MPNGDTHDILSLEPYLAMVPVALLLPKQVLTASLDSASDVPERFCRRVEIDRAA